MQGVALDPRREIVMTASGVQALNVAIRCVLDPGDEAIVLTPAWPNGSSIVAMANAKAIEIPQPLCGDRYEIDWDALEAAVTPRTRLLIYTSPSNPLGWVATEADQERLLDFARRHGLWLLADEVYDRLWYEGGAAGNARSLDSAQGDARRCGHGGAFVQQELLHDGMAHRLVGRPRGSGGEGDAAERVHHFSCAELHAKGGGDGTGGGRGRIGRCWSD